MLRTFSVFSSLAVCCAHEPAPAWRVAGGGRSCERGRSSSSSIGMAAGEQVSVQLRERQGKAEREARGERREARGERREARGERREARGEQNAGSSTYGEQ